ncbi:hypothetical protein L873DRAFT_1803993 [Choiromyces venosus 120613-1]|uniref:Uncharacterized protein n=1 Tax=Choiromyces venosus 120613-1 TaxID=1336337 RepID=A0A3N4JVB1_9PEZI|nr:hypothetical protein L873DRAFT_1803993 [Choiromyces venosus 120613-1]
MSTSPYFDGSTSIVRYDVQRAGSVRPGVTSYTRERDFPRATYTGGVGYSSRGSDYAYDPYDLALAEQRELEEIRLAEYRRDGYSRGGPATIITNGAGNMRGGKTVYLTSGRSGMNGYPPAGYTAGVRTVNVARSGPVIHRALPKYTNQLVDYGYDDYADGYDRMPIQAIRVPASSGGRVRRYPTIYDNQRGFGTPCGYENDCREQLVRIPASRAFTSKRYY